MVLIQLLCVLRSSSFVISVTSRCARTASAECATPSANTIWSSFQSGMVFTMVTEFSPPSNGRCSAQDEFAATSARKPCGSGLEVMQLLLFKAVALLCKVVCRLRVLRQAGKRCALLSALPASFSSSGAFCPPECTWKALCGTAFSFGTAYRASRCPSSAAPGGPQAGRRNLIHVHFGLVVTRLHAIEAVCLLFKEAEEALLFAPHQSFQLYNKVQVIPHRLLHRGPSRAHISKAPCRRSLRFSSGAGAILHQQRRVCNVNFFRKVVYDPSVLRA